MKYLGAQTLLIHKWVLTREFRFTMIPDYQSRNTTLPLL